MARVAALEFRCRGWDRPATMAFLGRWLHFIALNSRKHFPLKCGSREAAELVPVCGRRLSSGTGGGCSLCLPPGHSAGPDFRPQHSFPPRGAPEIVLGTRFHRMKCWPEGVSNPWRGSLKGRPRLGAGTPQEPRPTLTLPGELETRAGFRNRDIRDAGRKGTSVAATGWICVGWGRGALNAFWLKE